WMAGRDGASVVAPRREQYQEKGALSRPSFHSGTGFRPVPPSPVAGSVPLVRRAIPGAHPAWLRAVRFGAVPILIAIVIAVEEAVNPPFMRAIFGDHVVAIARHRTICQGWVRINARVAALINA